MRIPLPAEHRKILLLSNTQNTGKDYLEHAAEAIRHTVGKRIKKILFIPYAEVSRSFHEYSQLMHEKFSKLGYELYSLENAGDRMRALAEAEAIYTGGGNTFHLLYHLRTRGLMQIIRDQVDKGVPYIGSSAGANITCPTIKTTNDMPIIDPGGFEALNLLPFQFNPHFIEETHTGHQGENRVERILEFIELHPGTHVIGLREGNMLQIEGSKITLLGVTGARVFRKGEPAKDYLPGDAMDFLFTSVAPNREISALRKGAVVA